MRQLQVVGRQGEEFEQGEQVTDFQRRQQTTTGTGVKRNANRRQGVFVSGHVRARTQQQHEVTVARRAGLVFFGNLPGLPVIAAGDFEDFCRQRVGFAAKALVFRLGFRFTQRIAQGAAQWRFFRNIPSEQRQQFDPPRQIASLRGLLAERGETRFVEEQGVDYVDNRQGVAPRCILFEKFGGKVVFEEVGRDGEEARFGAAEAVDRLLGVADEEQGRAFIV